MRARVLRSQARDGAVQIEQRLVHEAVERTRTRRAAPLRQSRSRRSRSESPRAPSSGVPEDHREPPGRALTEDLGHRFEVADRLPARIEHDAVVGVRVEGAERLRRTRRAPGHAPFSPESLERSARARPVRGRSPGARGPSRSRAARRSAKRPLERLPRLDRLLQGADRAHREGAGRVFLRRDHVDRDVPRGEVVLQPLQDPPAVDDRQLDVQRDGVDARLGCERAPARRLPWSRPAP